MDAKLYELTRPTKLYPSNWHVYGTCIKSNKAVLVGKVPGILRGRPWWGSIVRAGEQERSVLVSSHVGLSYSVFPTRVSNSFYNQVLNTENNSH